METIDDLEELDDIVGRAARVYLRYSFGPERDLAHPSRDYEAEVDLPGLPCTLLTPEPWWPREPVDWIARRVCKYLHLAAGDPRRRPWITLGEVAGYGPDHEPLLGDIEPIGWLGDRLVEQARGRYRERFRVGRTSLE